MDLNAIRQVGDIDGVVLALEDILRDETSRQSPRAFFPALYRQVTVRVRDGIAKGVFDDGPRMNRFDTLFARRYLVAWADWREGRVPSKSWRVAFAAADDASHLILQHLLLGMNAHINLDLGVAAAEVAREASIDGLRGDFMRINEVLGSLQKPVQTAVEQHSPLLGVLDKVGGRTDDAVVRFSIVRARDAAWLFARTLAAVPDALHAELIALTDDRTAMLGRSIASPGGLVSAALDVVRASEDRDVAAVARTLDRVA